MPSMAQLLVIQMWVNTLFLIKQTHKQAKIYLASDQQGKSKFSSNYYSQLKIQNPGKYADLCIGLDMVLWSLLTYKIIDRLFFLSSCPYKIPNIK